MKNPAWDELSYPTAQIQRRAGVKAPSHVAHHVIVLAPLVYMLRYCAIFSQTVGRNDRCPKYENVPVLLYSMHLIFERN